MNSNYQLKLIILFGIFFISMLLFNNILSIILLVYSFFIFSPHAIRYKLFLSFSINFIISVMYLITYFKYGLFEIQETSWRSLYNIKSINREALYYIHFFLCFFMLFIMIFVNPNRTLKKYNDSYQKLGMFNNNAQLQFKINRSSEIFISIIMIFFAIIYLIFDFQFLLQGKIQWMAKRVNFPFIELCEVGIFSLLFIKYNYRIKSTLFNIVILIFTLIFIFLFVTGLRAPLVSLIFFYGTIFTFINRFTPKKYFFILPIFPLLYTLIAVFGTLRREEPFTMSLFIRDIGNHESNEFFTLVGVIYQDVFLNGLSYINSLLRLLPNFVFSSNDTLGRSSVLLAEIVMPNFNSSDDLINMGAFFLSEAYMNFGSIGIYICCLIISLYVVILEIKKYNSSLFLIFYIFFVLYIFQFLYYGMANFLKIYLYQCIIFFIFKFILSPKINNF